MVETAWLPMLGAIDAANDDFIRTTQPRHTSGCRSSVQQLYDADQIFKGSYTGPVLRARARSSRSRAS